MIQDDDDDDIIIYKQVLWGNIWKVLTLRDQNFLLLPFTDWIMPRLVLLLLFSLDHFSREICLSRSDHF